MSGSAYRLMLYVLNAGGIVRSSNAVIAAAIGRCSRTVNRALGELEENGAVTLTYSRTTGPGEVGRAIRINDYKCRELIEAMDAKNGDTQDA